MRGTGPAIWAIAPHNSTAVPTPAPGHGVKSTVIMSMETLPTMRVRTPSTTTGVPVGACLG